MYGPYPMTAGGLTMEMKPVHKTITIGLVGNPNCGKTSIFNALTGARHKVANWSGVTVEKREGHLTSGNYRITVVDLPGIYSLTSYSMEEIVTRDFIIEGRPDVIVNIVDAGNLERNLYLTTQLINIGARMVMALNMSDEAEAKGVIIDAERLGTLLGMPVVRTIGHRSTGINGLIDAIIGMVEKKEERSRHIHIPFGNDIESEIRAIQDAIWKEPGIGEKYSTRWLAVRLLEQDSDVDAKLRPFPSYRGIAEQAAISRSSIRARLGEDPEVVITDRRYGFIAGALKESVRKKARLTADFSERIDRVLTNRWLGFPVLFIFMWALFYLTFTLGEYPMMLIEAGIAAAGAGIESLLKPGPLKDLLIDGIIGGVGGVIVFLPNILILFAGISFMEDTGYMARAAFIMDRIMHAMGLHGKSFIPMVMGFGCNVPAIMATRSLESRQDRILGILINPFMSCSARLPLYILFAGIFFHDHAGTVIVSLYGIGIALAFLSARLHRLLFFRGKSTPFVMELPPYRVPTMKATLLHMWDRASQYLRKMGGIILAFSIVIWALGSYPKSPEIERRHNAKISALESSCASRIDAVRRSGSDDTAIRKQLSVERERLLTEYAAEKNGYTAIGRIGSALHPFLSPLGFNWQMGVSLLTGLVAKEVVVSTMGVLYHAPAPDDPEQGKKSLGEVLAASSSGITPLTAYAFMLFVLLYVPCAATIAVIGREAGWGWAAFSVFYQLVVAWLVSFIFYRGGLLLGL